MYGISQTSVHTNTLKVFKARTVPFPPVQTWLWILARLQAKYFLVASWSCPSGFPVLMFYLPCCKQPRICGWAHSSDENVQRLTDYWHDTIRMSCMRISVVLGWSSAQSHWELGRAWFSDHWTYGGTHDFKTKTWGNFPGWDFNSVVKCGTDLYLL